ncbi:MAG: hypothetical protein MZW92_09405 [Comamonadaceae bacterium]|nr:hypothetical protein [Comamonadaceae bacterium]
MSRVIPLFEDEQGLAVAMANPTDDYVLSALRLATGKSILPRVAIPTELEIAFERLYGSGRSAMGQIVDSIGLADDLTDEEQIQHLKDLRQRGAGDPAGEPDDRPRAWNRAPPTSTSSRSRTGSRCATASTACCTRWSRRRRGCRRRSSRASRSWPT